MRLPAALSWAPSGKAILHEPDFGQDECAFFVEGFFLEVSMKILVPVKRVPDYEVKIKLRPDNSGVLLDNVKWVLNPFDEIAVEEAVRIKEARGNVEVVAVTIGSAATREQLQGSLAMGADRGIIITADGDVDSDVASRALQKIVEKESPDLVILGKQAVDSDANQTGQLLAARLGLPQATFASKIVLSEDGTRVDVTREVDGGLETLSLALPAVVTTDLRLNEPRYLSLPAIVKAKKKPVEEIALSSLGVSTTPVIKITSLRYPPGRSGGAKVGSVGELVEKLQNEAKVLS